MLTLPPSAVGLGGRAAREALVAVGLELFGEFRAAGFDDAAVDEDVHEVGLM